MDKNQAVQAFGGGLGALVTWDLYGTKVRPADLRAMLAGEGLTEDAGRVPSIDARKAVKRAAQEWSKGRGNADRYRTEVMREDGAVVEIGVLKRERISTNEVRWAQVDLLALDTSTGAWTTGSAAPTAEATEFQALAGERMEFLDHDWIRPELLQRKMASWHAFGLRRQGGVYFVAAAFDAELQALQRVVGKLGDSKVEIYHLAQTAQTTAALEGGARTHAAGQLADLRGKLADWRGRAGSVRTDAVENMVFELKALKDDVQFYADALQISLDDLQVDLDAAITDARVLVISAAIGEANPAKAVRTARTDASPKRMARWVAAIALATERGLVLGGVVRISVDVGTQCGIPMSTFKYPGE